jgi:hypothetical protein
MDTMHTPSEMQAILGAMMTPAAMTTACSLLLLGVYDKYSKILASIRALNVERRGADAIDPSIMLPEQERREFQVIAELALLRRRLENVLMQVRAIVTATAAFLVASLCIGAGLIAQWNSASVVGVAVVVGFLSLLGAMVMALGEIGLIGEVLAAEHQPREARVPSGRKAHAAR